MTAKRLCGFTLVIFAALATFWAVNWLRSAVREPRALAAAQMTLASDEARPAPAPPREDLAIATLAWAPASRSLYGVDSIYDAVAIRWTPLSSIESVAPAAAPAPARLVPATAVPVATEAVTTAAVTTAAATTAAVATAPATRADPGAADDHPVAEAAMPAILGPVPLPRRKPTLTALAPRDTPPLPRRRPTGSARQSLFAPVGTHDDRYPEH